ncbi:hypothetical protein CYMTET_43348 [Cymbomonas tetramitiformis]|uniref:Histone H2A/H2B/H3 domain-containing protein n=1 Tax=Cymbomonas tetramitiformis TaxID=36881 RepID=A0AAE0C4D1_9CHLO|nr:hypothetical protein CYMTET_43348 [Cymbomonas tetramitiformis]
MTRIKKTSQQPSGNSAVNAERATKLLQDTKAANANAEGKIKKPHRWKSGTVAMRQMRGEMRGVSKHALAYAPFRRLVTEILHDRGNYGIRISKQAIEALREEAENFVRECFFSGNVFALNRGVTTVDPLDFRLGTNWLNGNMQVDLHRQDGIMAVLPMHSLAKRHPSIKPSNASLPEGK